jgi:hypothetical protein
VAILRDLINKQHNQAPPRVAAVLSFDRSHATSSARSAGSGTPEQLTGKQRQAGNQAQNEGQIWQRLLLNNMRLELVLGHPRAMLLASRSTAVI